MTDKESPLNRDEFKIITPNERSFIENPKEFVNRYKNPDAMARQYNNRIKYRSINAILDLLFITENLSDDQNQKIFNDDLIDNLFGITLKAIKISKWIPSDDAVVVAYYNNLSERERIILIETAKNREVKLKNILSELMNYYVPKGIRSSVENALKNPIIIPEKDELLAEKEMRIKELEELILRKGMRSELDEINHKLNPIC